MDELPRSGPNSRILELLACAEGSWGSEFYAGLQPLSGDLVVTKHRYSAFIGTDLDMLLRARGFKSLLITGVGTGMCVFHTLTVGFMLDYYITLVEDCCATTYGPTAHNEAVALVKKHYGRDCPSLEIIDLWSKTMQKDKINCSVPYSCRIGDSDDDI